MSTVLELINTDGMLQGSQRCHVGMVLEKYGLEMSLLGREWREPGGQSHAASGRARGRQMIQSKRAHVMRDLGRSRTFSGMLLFHSLHLVVVPSR